MELKPKLHPLIRENIQFRDAFTIMDARMSDISDADVDGTVFTKSIFYDKNRRIKMVRLRGEGFKGARETIEAFVDFRENVCQKISYSLVSSLKHKLHQVEREKSFVDGSISISLVSDYDEQNAVICVEYLCAIED